MKLLLVKLIENFGFFEKLETTAPNNNNEDSVIEKPSVDSQMLNGTLREGIQRTIGLNNLKN